MPALIDTFTMSNGLHIPKIGFGTWQIPSGADAYDATKAALDAGYRHIDTALAYGNEASVGEAVRDSGIPRDELRRLDWYALTPRWKKGLARLFGR